MRRFFTFVNDRNLASIFSSVLVALLILSSCAKSSRIELANDVQLNQFSWRIYGPMPTGGENGLVVDFLDGEDTFSGEISTAHRVELPNGGLVDFNEYLGQSENCVAYAYTEFESPRDGLAVLSAGSDDGIKIILNGDTVHEYRVFRAAWADQDVMTVPVQEGNNRLLVKVEQGTGSWGFFLKLSNTVESADEAKLVVIDPLYVPLVLVDGEFPTQQALEICVANFGKEAANATKLTLDGAMVDDSVSDEFNLGPGEVRNISVPMVPSNDLSAGEQIEFTLGWQNNGHRDTIPLRDLSTQTGAIHPLLQKDDTSRDKPFYIAQISDTHIERINSVLAGVPTAERLQTAVGEINAMDPPPAFVIVTGDFSHNSPDAYPVYHDIMSELTVPFLTVFGNHDKAGGIGLAARDFSEWGLPPYYAFEKGGQTFIILDTVIDTAPDEKGRLYKRERDWLNTLSGMPMSDPPVFFLHHNLLPEIGIENVDEAQLALTKFPEPIWLFSGHWHCDVFMKYGNQRHILTKSTAYGGPIEGLLPYRTEPGYRLIHFDNGTIKTEFKPLGGNPEPDPTPEAFYTPEEIARTIRR